MRTAGERFPLRLAALRAELLPNGAAAPLTRALAVVADELRHSAANLMGRRRLLRAARRSTLKPLRVHLGCGSDVRAAWLNIDLEPLSAARRLAARSGTPLIRYDLRRGLPLPAASCSLIYSSHFLEHLEFRQGLRLLRDCHGALVPGGRLRVALPDLRAVFSAYLAGDTEFLALLQESTALFCNEAGMESLVDAVNYAVYQHGEHRFIYDQDKIVRIFRAIGFTTAEIADYDADLDPPGELRRRYSFYAEATR